MTFRHLYVFMCVCDEGNMTAAAEKLHIAQPSVSQTIAELEKHYNVRLLERLGRKLFVTIAGQELLTYARHIVNLNKQVEDLMREMQYSGTIRVGASVTVGTCIFSQIMSEFIKYNPKFKLFTFVNNTKIVEEMLLEDKLDVGLVEGKIHSDNLLCEPFMEDELVLVSSVSHELAQKGHIKQYELNNMNFIVREEGSGTRELFESVMASVGVHWQIAGVYNSAEAIKNIVSAGLGISVMSRMAVQREVQRGELIIINIEGLLFKRNFSIVYHKNKYISPVLHQMVELCKAYKKN